MLQMKKTRNSMIKKERETSERVYREGKGLRKKDLMRKERTINEKNGLQHHPAHPRTLVILHIQQKPHQPHQTTPRRHTMQSLNPLSSTGTEISPRQMGLQKKTSANLKLQKYSSWYQMHTKRTEIWDNSRIYTDTDVTNPYTANVTYTHSHTHLRTSQQDRLNKSKPNWVPLHA